MTTVLLIGCGNMGFAMLKGWLGADPTLDVHVVEPEKNLQGRAAGLGAKICDSRAELPPTLLPDLVVLAVKPQVMGDIVPEYAAMAGGPATFVSVAAGTTISRLSEMLPGATPIIRCMPNTPAAIGHGMMVCCANEHVGQPAQDLTTRLLAASGEVAWIDDEALMDAVTAVSGSGPAYVFHMIEALGEAGEEMGLPADLSAKMALQTVMGAGLLAANASEGPGKLREQVTSPGGTTAAALDVLMGEGRLRKLMIDAVRAARDRGVELGKG